MKYWQKTGQRPGQKRPRRDILLNLIVRALGVILFIQAVVFIGNVIEYQKVYAADEAALIRQVTYQEYDSLVDQVCRNEAMNVPVKGDMAEIYAVAYYYEAAMLYKAHLTAGNTRQAQLKYERMQEFEPQMGEYAFAKEEIWKILGIG